ncbi:hypothetical protein ABRY23_05905 [Melioribacteraceae bacterium 4301-Me]|uniref:hypothetical protein n=1 Tax=Pyranulibacter aquaticus TaxID=3163344 RepID=UPI003598C3F3
MPSNSEKVDKLIDHLWKNGFLTLSRKYGKYLPEPKPIGGYDVDAIAKYKKKIAIGIILTPDEINDPKLISKLYFLAKKNSRFSNNKITLFLGVPAELEEKTRLIISTLEPDLKSQIKVVVINK